jgi:hypothetical protein
VPVYTIEGKRVRTEKPLSDAEIDEIAASFKTAPAQTPPVQTPPAQTPPAAPSGLPREIRMGGVPVQDIINVGAGFIRGAGSIGATILRGGPAVQGVGLLRNIILPPESAEENQIRRQQITEGLQALTGAQPGSFGFGAGKLGAEIAGTAAVPGLLARGAAGVGLPAFSNALRTGGFGGQFSGGIPNFLLRTSAGGAVGGTTAGVIDPSAAGEGAVLGAVLPAVTGSPVVQKTVSAVGKGVRSLVRPFTQSGKEELKALAFAKALNNDPTLIQRAIVLIQQGRTPEQVAVELGSTGLADLIKKTPQTAYETADIFRRRAAERTEDIGRRVARVEAGAAAEKAEVAATGERRVAELMSQQRAIGSRPPEVRQRAVGETISGVRESEISRRQKEIVTPAYEAAFEAAPNKFSMAPVEQAAADIRAMPAVKFDPEKAPLTAALLARYQTRPAVSGTPTGGPLMMGTPGTPAVPPTADLREANDLLRAIHEDIATLSGTGNSADKSTLTNLYKLRSATLRSIEEGLPPEVVEKYSEARDLARTQIIEPFREGWVLNLEREGATGVPLLLPERITRKVLESDTNALKFAASFHESPAARQAIANGVLGQYRREVVRDGVITPTRHEAFLRKYGDQLDALDTIGLDLRPTVESYGRGAVEVSDIPNLAKLELAQAKAQADAVWDEVSKLRERAMRPATPQEALANAEKLAEGIPGIREELARLSKDIQDGEIFKDLAREGSKVGGLKFKQIASEEAVPEPPMLSRVWTVATSLLRTFRGDLNEKLASQIAMELLSADKTTLALQRAERLARPLPKGARPVRPATAVAPGVIGANALAPESQNALAE